MIYTLKLSFPSLFIFYSYLLNVFRLLHRLVLSILYTRQNHETRFKIQLKIIAEVLQKIE